MPSNGAYTVNIKVDGVALEEFDVEQKDNVYSCWIASETGKNFSVHWAGAAQDVSLKCGVHMDGTFISNMAYSSSPYPINRSCRGRHTSENSIRLTSFSNVSLTDDDSIASPDQNLSNLGTIEVCIFRVELLRKIIPKFTDFAELNDRTIHERSKKLATHHVSLKERENVSTRPTYSYRSLENAPHARFVFKYRPRDFLVSQGIIPSAGEEPTGGEPSSKSNSPDPKGKKRKRAGTTETENEAQENARKLREKEKQLRELQAEVEELRRGGASGCDVKREVKVEPLAFPIDDDGVIDLTGD